MTTAIHPESIGTDSPAGRETANEPLADLESHRSEARRRILDLKSGTPFARLFNGLGRAKPGSPGYWLSNVVLLNLILLGPAALIALATQESERINRLIVPGVMAIEVLIAGAIVAHIVIQFMFDDLANQVVGQINNAEDLSKLSLWLKQSWSTRSVASFVAIVCPISVALFVAGFSAPIRQFAGVGFTFASVLAALLAGVLYYAAVWAFRVVASLKDYHYEMNAIAPADSQILSDVSDMVTRSIFILAAYFGSVTLVFGSSLVEPELRNVLAFPILVIGWAFIAAQFLLTRATLGAITNRAKWATLNKIRARVNALEATGDLSEKDTAERLLRLAGIHKEVMASKTNTLDLKTFATLTSQLMLPLLGLVLANLDKILALLRR